MTDQIRVTTHVARDLLQAAGLFRSPENAIWEYVVNGLEYVEPGCRPEVVVRIDGRSRRVTIADNGRGMDVDGLRHYFTMHGENIDRRQGRRGRGQFGTGKSAAFGVARRLEVATVRNGVRNVVELTRQSIETSHGEEIPVTWLVRDEPTGAPNGTVVTIDDLIVDRVAADAVIRCVERHLAFWRGADPKVMVDTHECEATMPTVHRTETFSPNPNEQQLLGDVELTVRVATAPLEAGLFGVAVTTAPGALVAVESSGIDRKEFGNYLFGEIECPALDDATYELAAYDASRSLQLNPQHPVAAGLIAFIGRSLDRVRDELVAEQRRRRSEREYKELQKEAARIARLLNDDLATVRNRFADLAAMRRRQGAVARSGGEPAGDEPTTFVEGDEEPGFLDPPLPSEGPGGAAGDGDGETPELGHHGTLDEAGPDRASPAGGRGERRRPRGGLQVEYRNLGADKDRGIYDANEKLILINLDHPMIVAAKSVGGVEDVAFTRLSYEVAISTYALGLTQELLEQDPELSGDDVLFECRDALRRVTASAAGLYRAARP